MVIHNFIFEANNGVMHNGLSGVIQYTPEFARCDTLPVGVLFYARWCYELRVFKITWLKEDEPYSPSEGAQLVFDNQTLLLRRGAMEGKEARYTCRATNKVGRAEKDFVIQLKG